MSMALDAPLRGLNLLVVDDNEINRTVASDLMQLAGATVELAESGLQAIARMRFNSPGVDAIIMDIRMPDMNGYDATRVIRAQPGCETLPIVALTANDQSDDVMACFAAGMSAHLAKPLNMNILVDVLLRYCQPPETAKAALPVPSAETALPDIPGFDLSATLARLGGDRQLFGYSAQLFRQTYADLATNLSLRLMSDGPRAFGELMHDLKGTAATLGAQSLASHASEIHDYLRKAPTDPAYKGEVLACELQRIQASLLDALVAFETVENMFLSSSANAPTQSAAMKTSTGGT